MIQVSEGSEYDIKCWKIGNKYHLKSLLAYGAYGTIAIGYSKNSNEELAIKKYYDVYSDIQESIHIIRELVILRHLNHPYIIKPIDLIQPFFGSRDLYMVMEYFSMDLEYLIQQKISLSNMQIKKIMYCLLSAIGYLHSTGIFHRDIKPSNVLINNEFEIKLCDFDSSRFIQNLITKRPHLVDRIKEDKNPGSSESPNRCINKNIGLNELHFHKTSMPSFKNKEHEEANSEIEDESPKIFIQKSPTLIMNLKDKENVNELYFFNKNDLASYLFKNRENRKKIQRKLSKHVTTRWYRSPEIILCENEYDYKVDVWSAGCIFAELLNNKKENKSSYIQDFKLFKGGFCPPLSPTLPEKNSNLQKDQMATIIDILGYQDDQSLSFISDEKQIYELKKYPRNSKKEWKEIFPCITKDEASLLSKMIEFNPYFRATAQECLQHPYFSDAIECIPFTPAEGDINLNMDKYKTIDRKLVKKIIWDEVEYYKVKN